MPTTIINGISVDFPFEPYDVQRTYMEKVIECLQNRTNGILESPTGTGKTLNLLCATLAWIVVKKAEARAIVRSRMNDDIDTIKLQQLNDEIGMSSESQAEAFSINSFVPKVIYASRTHSQIAQVMTEMKRTAYSYMRAAVVGSRDQLCIHPDVMNEVGNSNKIHMCKMKIDTRTCSFHSRVERAKDNPAFQEQAVVDIEDLVRIGKKLKCCPYYVAKELVQQADIIFMPYNYLLDPKARKANKVELQNAVIILDEAHNVEKMCEEAASVDICSTEIAVCIDDVTHIMKEMERQAGVESVDGPKDFTLEDLAILKEILLQLEQAIDDIPMANAFTGQTFPGVYIFELFEKATITSQNQAILLRLLDSLIQFLTAVAEQNTAFRRGAGLQKMHDLLTIAFSNASLEYREKIGKCFKIHVEYEKQLEKTNTRISKNTTLVRPDKAKPKVVSYWCFSATFGMQQLIDKQVHCIILTSGTLAPLNPLISELGLPVKVRLENPHIVGPSQVYVQVVSCGPDKEELNSRYDNRDNAKYVNSMGRTIVSVCPIIPHGLLVFFPSYYMLNMCRDSWQISGIWSQIQRHKPIYIEPRTKDAYNQTMTDYYSKINDPLAKGACFMAVCRGKVSEGLDFADANGRAVIITGLPFPPLKDPKVVLKRSYLDSNRTKENELLTGQSWYTLEASRAVNQAIGRVIRHRNDYGAILLCDSRFQNTSQQNQLSGWVQKFLSNQRRLATFGMLIGDLSKFFKNCQKTLPQPNLLPNTSPEEEKPIIKSEFFEENFGYSSNGPKFKVDHSKNISNDDYNGAMDFSAYKGEFKHKENGAGSSDFLSRLKEEVVTIDLNRREEPSSAVTIHKRDRFGTSPVLPSLAKRRRYKLVSNEEFNSTVVNASIKPLPSASTVTSATIVVSPVKQSIENVEDRREILKLVRSSVTTDNYGLFIKSISNYYKSSNFEELFAHLTKIFEHRCFHYLFKGMKRFIKEDHKSLFDEQLETFLSVKG